MHLLKNLSKTDSAIHFIETVEDDELLKKMKRSLKSGKASRKEVDKTLKAILGEEDQTLTISASVYLGVIQLHT